MAKTKKSDSVVLTARQLLNGYTVNDSNRFMWNTAPYQMIPVDDKDEDWRKWNMDWLEHIGMRQLSKENKRLRKNYDLANGVLDRSDYMINDENEFSDLVGMVTQDTGGPFSLKFYPIIPNIIQVLTGEFAKRDKRIIVNAVDEYAENEALNYKMEMLSSILTQDAQSKLAQQMMEQGIDMESPESQEKINVAAQLAEAQVKYKSFRGIAAQWGQHKVNEFEYEFRMYEKEIEGFKDSLIADREFWHIDIRDDFFNLELWNPINVFYHKSPEVDYISDGNYVGHISLMSIPDVIDMYGREMTPDQIDHLKEAQSIAIRGGNVQLDGYKHDSTNYYDASKPYGEQQPNSIHMEQYMGMKQIKDDIEGEFSWDKISKLDVMSPHDEAMIRVTRAYWKSQRRVGHLIRIMEDGSIIQDIVDEAYKVTIDPVYDTSIVKNKDKNNLVYGEHIDWIWINEVWSGIKIGANNSTYYQSRGFGFDGIYLNIKPVRFQFKGEMDLYGGKLPVEGKIFSERNSVSQGMVDRMKAFQLGYTIVNNQVMDFIADEIGKTVLIDQNMIPRNSLGGEWGKYNFPRFFQIMKDYQMAPVDSSMHNTETPATAFSHFQVLDLSKTDQIMGRLQLAEYFKNAAFATIGVTPQRVGQVAASESATGVQQAVNQSYSQTEMYFEQHSNFLMPRVYQMMLEAAQFITAEKPESRVAYLNKQEETVWFRMEGWRALLSKYCIHATSKADVKKVMEELKTLAMENNTAGGSLYEISQILTGDSPPEIVSKLKEFDVKRQEQMEAERQNAIQMQREQQQFMEAQREKELNNENYWKERDIQKELAIAAMKEGSKPADTSLLDQQKIDMDRDGQIQERLLKQREMDNENNLRNQEMNIKKEQLNVDRENQKNDLQIAKIQARSKPKPKK